MILEKNVKMIFPSEELGRKIAGEDAKTQSQVLKGFSDKQLMDCTGHSQPIKNLVGLLPSSTVLWFVNVYKEILKQKKITEKLNEEIHDASSII